MRIENSVDAVRQAVKDGGCKPCGEQVKTIIVPLFPRDSVSIVFRKTDSGKESTENFLISDIMLDPFFWQALGRARGWAQAPRTVCSVCGARNAADCLHHDAPIMEEWIYHSVRWFMNRLLGRDETKFWRELP